MGVLGTGPMSGLAAAQQWRGIATGETMRRFRMLRAAMCTLLGALSVASCAVVDRYSDRAVQYNLEAEQVQGQDILLNIARASKRHPLEFSGVQSISGTASASASSSLTFPFGRKPGPNSFTLTDSVSGGPTFQVSVLDTQEFYQGILKPIELSAVDLYVEERYSPSLLLNLFFSSIVIKQTNSDKSTTQLVIANNVNKQQDLERYQLLADFLINIGLTTRAEKKVTAVGPVLSPQEAAKLDQIARAAAASLDIKEVGWCDLSKSDREVILRRLNPENYSDDVSSLDKECDTYARAKQDEAISGTKKAKPPKIPQHLPQALYRAQKSEQSAKFCFARHLVRNDNQGYVQDPSQLNARRDNNSPTIDATNVGCDPPPKPPEGQMKPGSEAGQPLLDLQQNLPSPQVSLTGTEFTGLVLGPEIGARLRGDYRGPTPKFDASHRPDCSSVEHHDNEIDFCKPISLAIQPRSTEGIIYYLGEVVRRWLYPDYPDQGSFQVLVRYGPYDRSIPYEPCKAYQRSKTDEYGCELVFGVNAEGAGPDAFLSVTYDGERYAIGRDVAKFGRTYQVIDVVTQLLALHKSAKDLPATSVFTIVSPP